MYALPKLMLEVWAMYEAVALEKDMNVWYMVETVQLEDFELVHNSCR